MTNISVLTNSKPTYLKVKKRYVRAICVKYKMNFSEMERCLKFLEKLGYISFFGNDWLSGEEELIKRLLGENCLHLAKLCSVEDFDRGRRNMLIRRKLGYLPKLSEVELTNLARMDKKIVKTPLGEGEIIVGGQSCAVVGNSEKCP